MTKSNKQSKKAVPAAPPAPKVGKIPTSPASPEEIIKNPLTGRIKNSIAKSKNRLNFAVPFLSSFALELLNKKTISKIEDKRIITRFEDSSLISFDLKTLRELLELGFEIRYDNSIHLKLYITDDDAYVSSSNLTKSGFEDNVELSVKTDASNISHCVAMFNEIWEKCAENALTENLIAQKWYAYEFLLKRAKFGEAIKKRGDVRGVSISHPCDVLWSERNKFGINLANLIDEIFDQGIDPKIARLALEANKQREKIKRNLIENNPRFWGSIYYDSDKKGTLLYELAHGYEHQLAGTGLIDSQFLEVFRHDDFEKVISYIYPESIGRKPWNLWDTDEFLEFCNGIFDFKIPQYKEVLPIRLASYFYPDRFLSIFNLEDLEEICLIMSGSGVHVQWRQETGTNHDATLGDRLFYCNLTLLKAMKSLPFDNYTKSGIAYRILYATRLYKRQKAGEKYEEILNACETAWEKDLFEKGRDLFVRLKIIDDAARLETLGKIAIAQKTDRPTDQANLTRIAKSDEPEGVRVEAINNLTDQAVLADLVENDKSERIRLAAVAKLTDQTVLAGIVRTNSRYTVRAAAVQNITDQAILAEFAEINEEWGEEGDYEEWKEENWRVRAAAVGKLTDQKVLANFAKNDDSSPVRAAAVRNLADQKLMARIAKKDWDWGVCVAAVENLTDIKLLADVAKNKSRVAGSHASRAAVEKLTDQAILADIAKNGEDWSACEKAIGKLTDKAVLSDIAKSDQSESKYRRKAVTERIKNLSRSVRK